MKLVDYNIFSTTCNLTMSAADINS